MKLSRLRKCLLTSLLLAWAAPTHAASAIDFQDLTLPPDSFYNGADMAGGFTSGYTFFHNSFTDFGSFSVWDGFAYSNKTDTTTPGFRNQYSAYHTGDPLPGNIHAIGFEQARIDFPAGTQFYSARFTNNTYAALSMANGDGFAKKFGGPDGTDPDYLLLTLTSLDSEGAIRGNLTIPLADFRFEDDSQDYILDEWTEFDLSDLPWGNSLVFSFQSSDVGIFGINTPTYFAMDNLLVGLVPEPASTMGLLLLAPLAGCGRRASRRKTRSA